MRVGFYDKGNELMGGFSYLETKRYGVRFAMNPPFTPDCGPFLRVRAEHPVAVLEARREAMEAMADHLRTNGAALSYLRLGRSVSDVMPFYHGGFRVIPSYTYVIPLAPPLETILANMASVRRRNIQRAVKDELRTERVTDLNLVLKLVLRTFGRQEKFVDEPILRAILFRFANASNSYAFATFNGDEPLACAFVVHDRQTAFYLLGGYNDDEKHHGAGPAAMWECIRHAKSLGLREFDFEGSMIPAIERYFRGFGGNLTSFHTVNRAWFPLEVIFKLRKRNLF